MAKAGKCCESEQRQKKTRGCVPLGRQDLFISILFCETGES
jgi:hypothetical protein